MDLALVLRRELYASALAPGGVFGALESIRNAFHGHNVVVERMGSGGEQQLLHISGAPLPTSLLGDYAHFAALNPRATVGEAQPVGRAISDESIGDERFFDRDPYYNDFLGSMGLRYFVGGKLRQVDGRYDYLSLQRPAGAGAVSAEAREAFESLLHDVGAAMRIAAHIAKVRATLDGLIESLTAPAALFDHHGRPQRMNRAAQPLLARIGSGGSAILARAIWLTLHNQRSEIGRIECEEGAVVFFRTAPVAVEAAEILDLEATPQVLVFFSQLEADAPAEISRLALCLGVTLGEARVASRLADGQPPGDIAEALGLRHNTVRAHLAALRAKLDARSQVEIAAIVQAAWRAIGRGS